MVVGEANINNIMGGIESTGGVRLHNHKRKLKQRFDIIKKLGQGTYGKVQLGINKETGQEVAIKTIKKSKIETDADLIRIRREIQIMSSVQHPNIIHIYEVFENREKMVLVMEYAAGGELYDYLSERKVLLEEEARRIFRQIATACYYCHKHKICHRDLKLENILLDENGNAKIADFGLSNVFDDQHLLSTFCGSPLYASPEIVKGTPYHGPEVDCWSLGVLLYTLVYGAMPFDGSNFKRLVKQISQGDYFEPKKPSPASQLIREMLTVNPRNRANIAKICAHWWVNEGYDESCLDISEELANQTPVRLDLLLSLAPPPPQLESDKLVVTGEASDETMKEPVAPTRSQSVGSLMELQTPAERRIKDLITDESKASPKRKLETAISTDQANLARDGKKKDKIVKENTVADISVCNSPLDRSRTQTLTKDMEVEASNQPEVADPQLEGAACAEILEAAKKRSVAKVKTGTNLSAQVLDDINENPSQENLSGDVDKENLVEKKVEKKAEKESESKATPTKKKVVKKVLGAKSDNVKKEEAAPLVSLQTVLQKNEPAEKSNKKEAAAAALPASEPPRTEPTEESPTKPIERRRSRIFEQAEKFQNMITANEGNKPGPMPEKPKKIVIPGVSVGGFKKEFERKASLTSTSPPKLKTALAKKSFSVDRPKSVDQDTKETNERVEAGSQSVPQTPISPEEEQLKQLKLKNAVNIISQALDKEKGALKSKSRPCMRKPPVPFGVSGRSASGSIGMITSPLSPPPDDRLNLRLQDAMNQKVSVPTLVKCEQEPEVESKTSSAEITLKSATLPRRKTAKAQIELVQSKPQTQTTMGFKTEMAHQVEAPPTATQPKLTTQRSEVIFPVSGVPTGNYNRATSLEPDRSKERIIPITIDEKAMMDRKESVSSPPAKPPTPRLFQNQKSNTPQRSNSNLSRQSTQESDLEGGEPIKKSPREYIIPIAVEGGGYVTPRAGSLEPSETASTTSTMTNNSRRMNSFGRTRRMNSMLSDRDGSEDESPFGPLNRHSSFGKDSDTEDSRNNVFHMHRLRSSRPKKMAVEHNDSVSSGEDDDDDGFEILTAENLFSRLLSRVRDLTQRLNVDGRPGFPSSRLLSHFGHETDFFNNMHTRMNRPLGRTFSRESNSTTGAPWRRSVSRDLATDIDSVFSEEPDSRTHASTLPRGDNVEKNENLNLSDLDLKQLKLSDEDALALSYLTPGLSRRIQKQLLAQLPASEAKKLTRTLSMRNSSVVNNDTNTSRHSADRVFSTMPRKYSVDNSKPGVIKEDKQIKEIRNIRSRESTPIRTLDRTYLPIRTRNKSPVNDRSDRSESLSRIRNMRSSNLRDYSLKSPDSSLSESYSSSCRNNDSSSSTSTATTTTTNYNNNSNRRDDSLSDYSSRYNSYQLGSRSSSTSVHQQQPKADLNTSASMTNKRKTSRFLRPDFFDPPKEDNVVQKEKKERELETQQVLKEIRDKRVKNKLNLRRERSSTRDREPTSQEIKLPGNLNMSMKSVESEVKEVSNLLKNVSDNIRKIEDLTPVATLPNYVNVPPQSSEDSSSLQNHDYVNVKAVVVKPEKPSKLVRPKSYPAESSKVKPSQTVDDKKDTPKSKIGKVKKTSTTNGEKPKPKPKGKATPESGTSKNKFLQSIEKQIGKLRSLSNNSSNNRDEESKAKEGKKSAVKSAINKLREQSLPRKLEHCATESGLIKRAVSVEDVTSIGSKTLQPSRKSVTKILNLFKKYEAGDVDVNDSAKKSKVQLQNGDANKAQEDSPKTAQTIPKLERPKSLSLAFDKPKTGLHNGDKSSKLPLNTYRKSYNFDAKTYDPENRYSLTTTDDSSLLLSPCDDNLSGDSWSIGSDTHHHQHELLSPVSYCGHHLYSGDESESVIDRIRRKSFYSRFNENRRPRKVSTVGSYKDLDLYSKSYQRSAGDYGSLDRRSVDYRRSSYDTVEPPKREYKGYGRSSSALLHDGYANVPPLRYETYNPRRGKQERQLLDERNATEKFSKYSYQTLPSRNKLNRTEFDASSSSTPNHFDVPTATNQN